VNKKKKDPPFPSVPFYIDYFLFHRLQFPS
jgi:hypothetical protein